MGKAKDGGKGGSKGFGKGSLGNGYVSRPPNKNFNGYGGKAPRKGFGGKCYGCGELGHRRAECPKATASVELEEES